MLLVMRAKFPAKMLANPAVPLVADVLMLKKLVLKVPVRFV